MAKPDDPPAKTDGKAKPKRSEASIAKGKEKWAAFKAWQASQKAGGKPSTPPKNDSPPPPPKPDPPKNQPVNVTVHTPDSTPAPAPATPAATPEAAPAPVKKKVGNALAYWMK